MKFCKKHTSYILKRWPKATDENIHDLLVDMAFAHMPTKDFDIVQDRIQNSNSQCITCFYKKSGNLMLNLLISRFTRKIKRKTKK